MPVWLQITAAVSAALCSGVMGIALIPFLEKCRFCEPDSENQNTPEVSQEKVKPTMCGILLLFGSTAGLVLSYTLYMQFGGADRTGMEFQTESRALRLIMIQGLITGFLGWLMDYQRTVRRKPDTGEINFLVILMIFLTNYSFLKFLPEENVLNLGFMQWNAGKLSVFVRAVLLTGFWASMQKPEQTTDGISITASGVQCLCLAILSLSGKQNINALYALTIAGACAGCFYWNLPESKCRLGQTGTYWLGITIPMLCSNLHQWNDFLLYMAVWIVNWLPSVLKKKTLLELLKREGMTALQRIMILTGFALFCGILSIMPEHT